MPHGRDPARLTQVKEGRTWQIGDSSVVAWIAAGTVTGLTITSAIPPVFDDFATIIIPDGGRGSAQHDQLVIALLSKHSPNQPWWLGYLDTGSDDVIFPDAAPTRLYANWSYVLIEAGPEQALAWRSHATGWNRSLPELLFPADHSWLLSTLWDDDWRCLGGSPA